MLNELEKKIQKKANSDEYKKYRECGTHWCQIGFDKYDEYRNFDISKDDLSYLLSVHNSFSSFDSGEYLKKVSENVRAFDFTILVYELIFYIDSNAFKNHERLKNKYDDDRKIIGHTGGFQGLFVRCFIEYKLNGFSYEFLNTMDNRFKNLITYLDDPENNFPILNNKDKDKIRELFPSINECDFPCRNLVNKNYILNQILYRDDEIRNEWKPKTDESVIRQIKSYQCIALVMYISGKEKSYLEAEINDSQIYNDIKKIRDQKILQINNNLVNYSNPDYEIKGKPIQNIIFIKEPDFRYKLSEYGLKETEKIYKKIKNDDNEVSQNFLKNLTEQLNETTGDDNMSDTKYKPSLNQILYGPPGTGKTYNTAVKAMSVIDGYDYCEKFDIKKGAYKLNETLKEKYKNDLFENEYIKYETLKNQFNILKKQHRIEFVTFHQSYSYEEFVEGIKPTTKSDRQFENKDGIFKNIATEAIYRLIDIEKLNRENNRDIELLKKREYFKNKYPEGSEIPRYSNENNTYQITYTKDSVKCITETGREYGASWKKIEGLAGTVKKDTAVNSIANGSYIFSIVSAYENCLSEYQNENIEIKDIDNKKELIQKVYDKEIDLRKEITSDDKYVLIIDEINRGNISKIFGELITLIEDDKRLGADDELTAILPYSQEEFGISKNLYIIGTMNTADKSLALLDIALRRRFEFSAMYPKTELLSDERKKVLDAINKNILSNLENKNNKYDYLIGHAYFMKEDDIETVLKRKVIPLLMEYFNGNVECVASIINGKDKNKTGYKAKFDEKIYEWVVEKKQDEPIVEPTNSRQEETENGAAI